MTSYVSCSVTFMFDCIPQSKQGHPENADISKGTGAQETIHGYPNSSALEAGKKEDTCIAVEASLGEREGERQDTLKQADADLTEDGVKEQTKTDLSMLKDEGKCLMSGETDPSMPEENGGHKQTSQETDQCVLEEDKQEAIKEQSQGMFACD